MFKRTISALAIAALAYVGVAQAQVNATLTLKSGERISGQLVDMGGSGFTVKVNNEDRQVPTGDVAIIDFTGGTMSNSDWAKVNAGQQLVWLRSGETVTGTLFDIGGTSPLRLTIKTDSGERELTSNDVTRIVLARTDAAAQSNPATSNTAATAGSGIVVSGRQQWTPTNLTVRRGETISFNVTGEIQLSSVADDIAVAAGARSGRRPAANAPLPQEIAGALIGRIGPNGQPFGIGNLNTVTMPAAGQLFLGINDDSLGDNNGEFRVEMKRSGVRR